MKIMNKKSLQGFTLIELLIVIAVLGVLAAVVLVAINPLEQLARGRDAGRKSTASQLKNSVLAFFTARNGGFPADDATWIGNLVTAGEMNVIPALIAYAGGGPAAGICTPAGKQQRNYCYDTDGTGIAGGIATGALNAIVYVRLESAVEDAKCVTLTDNAYYLWQYSSSNAGTVCVASTGDPAVGSVYTFLP